MKYLLAFLLLIMLLLSCVLNDGSGGDSEITGTITNTGGYSNLKIGFFPMFGASQDLYLEVTGGSGGGSQAYLYYSDLENNSDIAVHAIKSAFVSAGSYRFSLPSHPHVSDYTNYYYYLIIWEDTDNDGILDLKDEKFSSPTNPGEYSRVPLKDLGGSVPAYLYKWYYTSDELYTGYSYTAVYDTYLTSVQLSTDTGGFNFELD